MLNYKKSFIFLLIIIIIAWFAGAILNSDKYRENNIENIVTEGECVPAGCSNQLCVEESIAGDIISTCEYKEVYSCYRKASCERQQSGECGWTETKELIECVGRFSNTLH